MRIDELNLISFGKFQDKHIKLKDGLNIIYGENEKGKSTVHGFIEGIFYGFLKPYVKRTLYRDEFEKYSPWNKQSYRGNMALNFKGEDYIIEKNFNKGEEKTSVKFKLTGEDISKNIDLGFNKKVLQPGYYFFNFNNIVYNNTVSIGQLNIKTDDKLESEIRDKLLNISNSLDENISVENTVKKLNENIRKIGNKRTLKTVYGNKNKELIELEREKAKILLSVNEYESLLDQLKVISGEIYKFEKNILKEKEELSIYRYNYLDKKISEARKIEENLETLRLKKIDYEKYKELEIEYYSQALILDNEIKNISEKIREKKKILISLSSHENSDDIESNLDYDKLYEDWENFEKLEIRKSNYYVDKNKVIGKNYKIITLLGIGLFLLVNIVSLKSGYLKIFGINILSFLLIIYGLKNRKKYLELNANMDIQREIENRKKDILGKYNIKNKNEFDSLLRKSREIEENKKNNKTKKNEKEERQNILNDDIDNLNISLIKLKKEFLELLKTCKSNGIDELAANIKKANFYRQYEKEINNKEVLLKSILKENTLEELEKDKNLHLPKEIKNLKVKSLDEIQSNIRDFEYLINSKKIEEGKIEEKTKHLEDTFEKLRSIEGEIDILKIEIEGLDKERESLELAKKTIENISKNIQVQHAPNINKKVSNIVSRITGGKYDEIKIDEKLNISILNGESNDIIDIEKLSKGTLDQLYLGLRMGVVNSIETYPLPILLDDSFVQYDDYRLKNVLTFLADESKTRQILLFTCQKRESKILSEEGIEYNLINL